MCLQTTVAGQEHLSIPLAWSRRIVYATRASWALVRMASKSGAAHLISSTRQEQVVARARASVIWVSMDFGALIVIAGFPFVLGPAWVQGGFISCF
jgi:hypothetical protein